MTAVINTYGGLFIFFEKYAVLRRANA